MSESFYDLVQLTDPHYLADPDGRLKDVHTRTTFVQVLTTALAESPPPVAILLTGDVTQDGSRAGYEGIREDLAKAGVPVWSLAGNHDDPVVMAEVMSGDGFHFCAPQRLGPWEVLLVSTWDGDRGGGRVGEAGLQTLARQLAASAAEHILVCLHHQPTPMGCAWLDGVGLDDAADFLRPQQPMDVPWIEAQDITNAMLWLCSDVARYVTGVTLPIDAGALSK